MENFKKALAEVIGTFVLVFIGTSSAVIAGEQIGHLGIALAFGLTIVAAAYSIGTVSGAHLNPAVSFAMFINKRLSAIEFVWYVLAQIIGAFLGSFALKTIATDKGAEGLGANALNGISTGTGFLVEAILTFIFVLVIVTVTSNTKGNAKLAGLVIGLTLTMVHLVGIPLTGTSVNPARSIAPALLSGGAPVDQLWLFILAPLVGGLIAALVGKYLLDTEN
ncbi:aquaporin [Lactococcus hodotermopsidis]|uniref:Aquaporin n=1 Tax=Pseudolactococcus hodotermopsidis TaxID=2709157 RepID=A0A6A0BD39_9LACT|nr:MIP family channel protein [Lactococcus hodotermopsidis]GFH42613.1 aquaporin [Lactococcus hodotermopsidis]